MVVEYRKGESVVAQRIVHEAITTAGGVCAMPVTKSMLSYAQGARQSQKCMAYLEAQKEKQDDQQKRKVEADECKKL